MDGGWLALIAAAVALTVATTAIIMVMRARQLSPDDPMRGARMTQLERRFAQLGQRLEVLERDFDALGDPGAGEGRSLSTAPAREAATTGARVGLVRFDAFDDTGGGQSFALALLDEAGDGVVLSSLHSRQASRLYVKDIRRGVADAPLSTEEERALRMAGLER